MTDDKPIGDSDASKYIHLTAIQVVEGLMSSVNRLKRGEFTPEEFQALCHHRDETPGCTEEDFFEGCRTYQLQLFGTSADAEQRTKIESLLSRIEQLKGQRGALQKRVSELEQGLCTALPHVAPTVTDVLHEFSVSPPEVLDPVVARRLENVRTVHAQLTLLLHGDDKGTES